jgi:hypothetical protein
VGSNPTPSAKNLVVTLQKVLVTVRKAARRTTIPDDTRRALPLGSPTGMAYSG